MAERIGRKWASPFSLSKNDFLVRFVICTSSYWLGQQSFTNLIMLCRTVIAYKRREVLKRDGVTLLCWWGNIHKFCISDEVISCSQSMYLTIPVIIRAWILLKNSCFVISVVYMDIDEEMFFYYWSVPNAGIAGKLETLPELTFMSKSGSTFPSKDKFATSNWNLLHV